MAETKTALGTGCGQRELVPLIDFAARELGQTRSSFFYIAGRDKLRALGVLPAPAIPAAPMSNGKAAAPDAPRVKPAAPPSSPYPTAAQVTHGQQPKPA